MEETDHSAQIDIHQNKETKQEQKNAKKTEKTSSVGHHKKERSQKTETTSKKERPPKQQRGIAGIQGWLPARYRGYPHKEAKHQPLPRLFGHTGQNLTARVLLLSTVPHRSRDTMDLPKDSVRSNDLSVGCDTD